MPAPVPTGMTDPVPPEHLSLSLTGDLLGTLAVIVIVIVFVILYTRMHNK